MTAPRHVLLVEDNELVTSAMRILFEAIDARVSVAGSVSEATRIGSADPADLVLLDLTLPDGEGIAVIQPLRAAGSRVFVALTGHDDAATIQRCLDAGCTDVVIKPPRSRELMAKAQQWLDAD